MINPRSGRWYASLGAAVFLPLFALAPGALAQEAESTKPWSNEAELAFVNTSGNASQTTFAFGDRFVYNWTYSELRLKADLYRATSEQRFLFNEDGGVREQVVSETAAERFEFAGQYRQNFVGNVYWYAMGSWYRNQPAGIDARYNGNGGVGYRFFETDATVLTGEFGIGVTRERQLGADATNFAEVRAAGEWTQTVTDTADFDLGAEALWNLANTDDLRINATAALTSRISSKLALRVGYDARFDNDPVTIIVRTVPDQPAAPFTLDKIDRTLSASLVLKF